MSLPVPDYIAAIEPYVTGKPIEALEREYGIRDSIKLASNENPLGPSPKAVQALQNALRQIHRYPDGAGWRLTHRLAEHLGVAPEGIVLGNGSDEIIAMLARMCLQPGDEVILPRPSFLMYEICVRCAGSRPVFVNLKGLGMDLAEMGRRITDRTRLVFICNPNNPTGAMTPRKDFEAFMEDLPDGVMVAVDEAYFEFVRSPDYPDSIAQVKAGRPVVTLRTFSKAYGLAGLRIGYGVTTPEIAAILHRVRQPFNANLMAQIGACAALEDSEFLESTRRITHEGLDYLYGALDEMGVRYSPTQANFFLIDVGKDAGEVFEALLRKGVIVRSMAAYGYPTHIRVNAGKPRENERFIQALKAVLE